jgi:hypothetical protein
MSLTLQVLIETKDSATFSFEILTFVGYSGAGYEDPDALHQHIKTVLSFHDPKKHIINCGATEEGIGVFYEIAKACGFETMGIVSSKAATSECKLSRYVDTVFFVADETWGGCLPNGKLSPTSAAMVAVSDMMVGIGGGAVARDELLAARQADKRTIYIPADLDHQKAIKRAVSMNEPIPTDFSGAANVVHLQN